MNDFTMTRGERRATWALGSVFSLRMLGMFMVLPVLSTYLGHVSPASTYWYVSAVPELMQLAAAGLTLF